MSRFKLSLFILLALSTGILLGRFLVPGGGGDTEGERQPLYWGAPMDPSFRSDKPGKSPMGMDLVPVYAKDLAGQDQGGISISPTVVNNLGVRTAVVERGALSPRIETVGYLEYNEETLQHIHTRAAGWIENLNELTEGAPVEKGQLLFEIYSPTLVNAGEEYLSALRSGNSGLIRASRDRLRALAVSDIEISKLESSRKVEQQMRSYATSAGFVVRLPTREGRYVTEASEIMTIANLETIWLIAEIFERQSALVAVGQQATARFGHFPGREWRGVVEYVYPALDPQTRTLRARLRFDNPDYLLKPEMFAEVTIEETPRITLSIPREALIRGERIDRVVMDLGGGRFRVHAVTPGVESADRVEIIEGLEAGQRVVVSGQFLIDSESGLDAELSRLNTPPNSSGHEHDTKAVNTPPTKSGHEHHNQEATQ